MDNNECKRCGAKTNGVSRCAPCHSLLLARLSYAEQIESEKREMRIAFAETEMRITLDGVTKRKKVG